VTGAALLSFIPKVAGLVALVRLLMLNPAVMPDGGWQTMEMTNLMIGVLAVASMTIGNMLALQQHDIRRLLAWSSVAHGGYLLVGLAVAGKAGAPVDPVAATLFYLVAYGAMTVGAFAVLGMLERREQRIERIDELAGLGHSVPGVALMMALFLFSLTGLPPTAGFLGKWNLFLAAWSSAGQMGRMLAIAMAVNAAIGAWYYLRVIGVMYLEPTPRGSHSVRLPSLLAGISCCAATIAFFLVPGWLWQLVG
jgi:NADH-quinone oxidoreductase subunit N